jgi:hypothetical protein
VNELGQISDATWRVVNSVQDSTNWLKTEARFMVDSAERVERSLDDEIKPDLKKGLDAIAIVDRKTSLLSRDMQTLAKKLDKLTTIVQLYVNQASGSGTQ